MRCSALALLLFTSRTLAEGLRGPDCTDNSVLTAEFNPKYAGGVAGTITTTYKDQKHNPLEAKIKVDMDISQLDVDAIKQKYPKCSYPVTKLAWHIHVKWNNKKDSGFLSDCSPEQTGGHYDPTFACGPASQYGKDVTCTAKSEIPYACSAETFPNQGINCEMGDFSGKFGPFEIGRYGKIKASYEDFFFPPTALYNQPMYLEPNVQWNFVLHLVCPEHKNPRIACAFAHLLDY